MLQAPALATRHFRPDCSLLLPTSQCASLRRLMMHRVHRLCTQLGSASPSAALPQSCPIQLGNGHGISCCLVCRRCSMTCWGPPPCAALVGVPRRCAFTHCHRTNSQAGARGPAAAWAEAGAQPLMPVHVWRGLPDGSPRGDLWCCGGSSASGSQAI